MNRRELSESIKRRLAAGETSFEGEDLAGIDLSGMHTLENINFRSCNLEGAVFRGCTLRDSDFRDAALAGVIFEEADLDGCRIDGPELGKTNCREAYMEGIIITKGILDD